MDIKKDGEFIRLCWEGTPDEVIAQIKANGFSVDFLNTRQPYEQEYRRGGGKLTTSELPLVCALAAGNCEVVRTLVEYGVDTDPDDNSAFTFDCMYYYLIPRQLAMGNPEMMRILEKGRVWWLERYHAEDMDRMRQHFDRDLLQKRLDGIVWHIMRGVTINPEILWHSGYNEMPYEVKYLLFRMGVPEENKESFWKWIRIHGTPRENREFITAGFRGVPLAPNALDNFLHSMGLFPEKTLREIFTFEEMVEMMLESIRVYGTYDDKQALADGMESLFHVIRTIPSVKKWTQSRR